MAKKPAPAAPADTVALYDRLLATQPAIERKGAANPYTSVNGNMFTILGADGVLGLRLSAEDRAEFMAEHGAALRVAYGAVMKEYVDAPAALLADTERLAPWLAKSWAYAQSLKPKPTTRK